VKEESITDFLLWKWRELDKRFKFINITTFTRSDEGSRTGADFELELWLVGRSFQRDVTMLSPLLDRTRASYPYRRCVDAAIHGSVNSER